MKYNTTNYLSQQRGPDGKWISKTLVQQPKPQYSINKSPTYKNTYRPKKEGKKINWKELLSIDSINIDNRTQFYNNKEFKGRLERLEQIRLAILYDGELPREQF